MQKPQFTKNKVPVGLVYQQQHSRSQTIVEAVEFQARFTKW